MTQIGTNPFDTFQTPVTTTPQISKPMQPVQPTEQKAKVGDSFESSKKNPEKIGVFRLWFKRLTQEQIDKTNETRTLPKNAKFRRTTTGGYTIKHNIFTITEGTRTLPAGYEVRKNILGFTRVVPVDSEGLFLRKKQPKTQEI